MNCKNCGAILNSNDLFCKQCGQSVNNGTSNANNNKNETIQNSSISSTSNYNEQYNPSNQQYSNYNNYNSYNNNSNNSNIRKIILVIILAVVFWAVGFFLSKLIFGEKDIKDNVINNGSSQHISDSSSDKVNNKNNNTPINSSYIVTENGKRVSFMVESTLNEDLSVSDTETRCFDKSVEDEYLTIWVGEEYATMNEFMSNLEDKANRRKQNSEYSNVQLSDIKTKTINGKEFSYRTLTYNMGDTSFKDLYLAYEIENESLYSIEVEEYQLLTDKELNGLLNITITN